MRTDSPAAVLGHLGNLEDELAEMQVWYMEAAGQLADFEHWEKGAFLHKKAELAKAGKFEGLTTDKAKDWQVELALREEFADDYERVRKVKRLKAAGDKLWQALDARRSIAQTVMRVHREESEKAGQGAYPQNGAMT
jgi:hypothetical protein